MSIPAAIPLVSGRHRNRALATARHARAIQLATGGRTYQEIADELGYANRGTVHPIGFTGDVAAPSSLVLAFPGDVDDGGQPVTAGSTTSLSKSLGRSLTPLLHPTGETFERSFAWGSAEPTRVTAIAPFVVEVDADASAAAGVLRHAARLHRARPDLDVAETK